ncbi:nucleoside recognition GATE domain-containing membrane protein YjiH [Psychrobacillus sp. OK028]|uniref:YjiH family protein n=1 Tax=Psychrobacillus sp. OK028 TaxID=1884359 RepID=UPI000886DE21|nr:YjiH family protein [Psychrobacillus sp. OK028]SDN26665.1 nucleoside recognition GATE domain-containing membrane protein YjiH [Psychrobacillus sp. OK028]
MKKFSLSTWLLFLLPSIAGVILFMIPLPIDGGFQIPIAWLASLLSGVLEPVVQWLALITLLIAAIGSIIFLFLPKEDTFINNLFKVTPFWTVTRIVGAVFAILIIWQLGPEAIWSENTGGLLLSPTGLVSFLFTIFLFAGLLLPLLLNFGLLEFFGTMMVKIMRPLFKLPGRSAVDALTSWVGDGTIGVLLTSRQYEEGYYTKKEAAIIGSTFSVVSITFCIVVLEQVGLENYFIPYYLTVLLCGVVLAFIMPRIYPLAGKEDTHIDGRPLDLDAEKYPKNYNAVTHGLENALNMANKNRSLRNFFSDGIKNVVDMYIGVAPVVLAFGTIALMLAEYTSVFTILGKPFEPLLLLFGIPEAAAAAQTMVVGFADMFLPSILGASIESELTRFFIATMSVTQLIYMSEVGGLLLGSKIPVNFKDLLVIFLLRTLISFPIIAAVAHILF